MTTLYIDRKSADMHSQRGVLSLHTVDGKKQHLPLKMIDQIVIHGAVVTDTGTLGALADAGIGVALLTGRQGRRQASIIGGYGNDVRRRLAQYRAHLDPYASTSIAACILKRKLANQQRFLMQALHKRPDQRHALLKGQNALRDLRRKLAEGGYTLGQLRGLEGAAAAAYFAAYRHLFAKSLGFDARRRRPPPDPVNAALSLGYTLLHAEAVKILHGAGLDPYLGYLHEPAHGRESLAADIIEPMRPKFDALVWWMFRKRVLTADHFNVTGDACLLGKAGRGKFFSAYETQARVTRRWLRLFVHALIKHLMQKNGA